MSEQESKRSQVVLVTGVSRPGGIGSAIVKRLAASGTDVVMHGFGAYDRELEYTDADEQYVFALEKEMLRRGFNVKALAPSDLSVDEEPACVVKKAREAFGALHGMVLNHAYSVRCPILQWDAKHIDAHFKVNVRASMLMSQAFVEQHNPSQRGAITLFTSGQYLGPMTGEIAYAVSKEAIRGLCGQLSAALGEYKIRVNCINPGPTDTGYLTGQAYEEVSKMFPSGRWGEPEDVARLVRFLHSEESRWITGQTIASEGGFRRHSSV